jgi:HK97 family phage portal protein
MAVEAAPRGAKFRFVAGPADLAGMGVLLDIWRGKAPAVPMQVEPTRPAPSRRFAVGSDAETWNALVAGSVTSRVTRAAAQSVPAVKRARDLICGTLGTLPLKSINSAGEEVVQQLLIQPESMFGYVRSVTLARTLEDLFYDGSSLWLVVQRDATGFPTVVERIEWGKWTQDTTTREIRVAGREVESRDVILFTSPNEPLLVAGASAIRALIRLEATAALYLDEPEPASYFTAAEGTEPDEQEVTDFLASWRTARQTRSTAFVPSSVALNQLDRMTGEQMQLAQARDFSITEIARLTGIDAGWLSVNVTTRTYANIQDERRTFIDFVAAPYIHAIEERLSLNDVTPRGQVCKFNLDAFLRANTAERYAAHAVALEHRFLTRPEVRDLENRPPLPDDEPADDSEDPQ